MSQSEEREVSIDSPEGLQEFLRFIDDVYRDFVVALQHTEGSEVMVRGDLLKVETARRKAEELVQHYIKVLDFGGEVFPEDIAELQTLYDTIVAAYDRLTAITRQSAQRTQALPDVSGIDATHERVKQIAQFADDLVYEFGELETVVPKTPELKLGKLLYDQLKATAERSSELVAVIDKALAFGASSDLLGIAEQIDTELDHITESLQELQKSLLRFFETDDFSDQAPKRNQRIDADKKAERAAKLFNQASPFTDTVKKLLQEPVVRTTLQNLFSSPAAFEAALKREVARIEAPSRLDKILRITHQSAFAFLKDMTLAEIEVFDAQPREQLRADLLAKDIPYEMYMTWMYAIPYFTSFVVADDDMTLVELFVRSEIEMLTIEAATKGNSQGVYNS